MNGGYYMTGEVDGGYLNIDIPADRALSIKQNKLVDGYYDQKDYLTLGHFLIRMTNVHIAEDIMRKQRPNTQVVIFIPPHEEAYEGQLYLFWDLKEWKELPVFYDSKIERFMCFMDDTHFVFDENSIKVLKERDIEIIKVKQDK